MRSCQDFIVRAMLDLTSAGHVPFSAADVYPLLRAWGAPCKELTVRAYVYAARLELSDGTPVRTERVARGRFRLTDPAQASAALLSAAPEWTPLLTSASPAAD
ncbi:hypothetical protein [Deinococcus sp. PEB2-63]